MIRPSKFVTSDEKPLNTHLDHRILVLSYLHPQLGGNTEAAFFFFCRQKWDIDFFSKVQS